MDNKNNREQQYSAECFHSLTQFSPAGSTKDNAAYIFATTLSSRKLRSVVWKPSDLKGLK